MAHLTTVEHHKRVVLLAPEFTYRGHQRKLYTLPEPSTKLRLSGGRNHHINVMVWFVFVFVFDSVVGGMFD